MVSLQIKKVKVIATLPSISTVEDFTDALKSQFISDVATAARVEKGNVVIIDVKAGSLIVASEIKFEAVNVTAAIQEFQVKIASPSAVFSSNFGDVKVVRQLPRFAYGKDLVLDAFWDFVLGGDIATTRHLL